MGRKRKSGEGTVRLRKDGRWEGRIVVGYDEKGLPRTKNVLAKTKGECVEKLKALKETIAPSTPSKVSADMTFGEWLDHWYETYSKPSIRPRTQRTYEGYIRLYIKPKLGGIPLNKLTTNDIQQFCVWMKSDDHMGGGSIADSQIRNCFSLCHRALEKARAEHLILRDPTNECKLSPVRYEEMKILSRESMQKLLIQAKEENYYELFLLELATGLRLGEICGLMWSDFDGRKGTLSVSRTLHREKGGRLTAGDTKTYAGTRTILLPTSTAERLRLRKKTSYSPWIFHDPFRPEAPLNPGTAYRQLKKILQETGLPELRFHDLRHTFATHALASGVDAKTLSGILGHTKASFTLDIYTHTTGDMQKRAAEIVGGFLTDYLGEEMAPWQNAENTATAASV